VLKAKAENAEIASLLEDNKELIVFAESELNKARASLPAVLCLSNEDMDPNPDKPEKILQFLHISSTIKKNVGGCVHVTYR
jgi:hypothetical protein